MKNINTLLTKNNNNFVNNLFNDEIIISEQLSAVNFSFIKDRDGTFRFYKKGLNFPINFYERTFTGLYEKAIKYVQEMPVETNKQIPLLYRFQFEYFPSNKPNYIKYNFTPKNNLVLTGVFQYDQFGKINQIFNNIEDLNKWADILDVTRPPVLFQGKLTKEQKNDFLDFVMSNPKTEFFKKFLSVLDITQEKTILGNDIEQFINGLQITFKNENKPYHVKMIDPEFERYVETNKIKSRSSILPIFYSEIISFFSINFEKIEQYEIKNEDPIKGYIELIFYLFKEFVDENGEKFNDIKLSSIPEFFVGDLYTINLEQIDNPDVLEIVKNNKIFQALLKIFLNLFKKKRDGNDYFINNTLLKYQHKIVELIKSKLSNKNSINEANTFLKFMELTNNDIYQYNFNVSDENEDVNNLKNVIDNFEINEDEDDEDKTETNVVYNKEFDFFINLRNKDVVFKNSLDKASLLIGSYPIFVDGFLDKIHELSNGNLYFYNIDSKIYTNPEFFNTVHNNFVVSDEILANNIIENTFNYKILVDKIQKKHIINRILVPKETEEYYKNIFEYYKLVDNDNFSDDLEFVEIPMQYYLNEQKDLLDLITELSSHELHKILHPSIRHLIVEITNNIKKIKEY